MSNLKYSLTLQTSEIGILTAPFFYHLFCALIAVRQESFFWRFHLCVIPVITESLADGIKEWLLLFTFSLLSRHSRIYYMNWRWNRWVFLWIIFLMATCPQKRRYIKHEAQSELQNFCSSAKTSSEMAVCDASLKTFAWEEVS